MKKETGNINSYGEKVFSTGDLVDGILKGIVPRFCIIDEKEEIEQYNKNSYKLEKIINLQLPTEDKTVEEFHEDKIKEWFIPEKYINMDVLEYIIGFCSDDIEKNRVIEEYELYESKNLVTLLKLMIYLVDHFREKNIVWGVGRGSSVSSFILYLIGIHKINSIEYDLDIKEFLR